MSANNGGPAFPGKARVEYGGGRWDMEDLEGMSLRDYYAGQALMGFCANPAIHQPNGMSGWSLVNMIPDDLAKLCDSYAESMIAAR